APEVETPADARPRILVQRLVTVVRVMRIHGTVVDALDGEIEPGVARQGQVGDDEDQVAGERVDVLVRQDRVRPMIHAEAILIEHGLGGDGGYRYQALQGDDEDRQTQQTMQTHSSNADRVVFAHGHAPLANDRTIRWAVSSSGNNDAKRGRAYV